MAKFKEIEVNGKTYQFSTLGFPANSNCIILDKKDHGWIVGSGVLSTRKGFFSQDAIITAIDLGYDLTTKEGIGKAIADKNRIKEEFLKSNPPTDKNLDDMKDKYVFAGKYLSGHPEITKFNNLPKYIRIKEDELLIIETAINTTEELINSNVENKTIAKFKEKLNIDILGSINIKNITNVNVEDASTVEKRVTATRLVTLGIFAFAAKKKEKHDLYYLTIKWKDGKFEQEVIFEFDGKDSKTQANKLKAKIIEYANKY
jgi:hypothetical protein